MKTIQRASSTFLVLSPLMLSLGCGASDAGVSSDDDYEGASTPTPYPGAPDDGSGEGDGLPEEEQDSYFRAPPAATNTYVFVVNPDRDTVSKVNATTQAVYTLPVGVNPTQVLTGENEISVAAVLNNVSHTISLIDVESDEVRSVPIHPDTNYMALRNDARYAVTWFNQAVAEANGQVDGVRSYSSISVVFTGESGADASSTPLTVGLNPRQVAFIADTDQALVLCEDTLALVELSPTPTTRLIRLTTDPDENLSVSEMKVTDNGHYAFLRLAGRSELVVVDLREVDSDLAVSRLALPGVPTDMELSNDQLILVDRASKQLLVYAADAPEDEPEVVYTPENQVVGSIAIAPELGKAILYTTLTSEALVGSPEEGVPLNRFSVWTLGTSKIQLMELVKPVEAILLNHNAGLPVATILHDGTAPSDQEAFNGRDAFSHYYFSDDLVVPAVLEAPIKAVADSPEGTHAFMILEDTLNVVVANYRTRQLAGVTVQSTPAHVGILTGTDLGWVSQEHELGRISFIDPDDNAVTTITGFELNSQP